MEWVPLMKGAWLSGDSKLMERMFTEALDKQLEAGAHRTNDIYIDMWLQRVQIEQ